MLTTDSHGHDWTGSQRESGATRWRGTRGARCWAGAALQGGGVGETKAWGGRAVRGGHRHEGERGKKRGATPGSCALGLTSAGEEVGGWAAAQQQPHLDLSQRLPGTGENMLVLSVALRLEVNNIMVLSFQWNEELHLHNTSKNHWLLYCWAIHLSGPSSFPHARVCICCLGHASSSGVLDLRYWETTQLEWAKASTYTKKLRQMNSRSYGRLRGFDVMRSSVHHVNRKIYV